MPRTGRKSRAKGRRPLAASIPARRVTARRRDLSVPGMDYPEGEQPDRPSEMRIGPGRDTVQNWNPADRCRCVPSSNPLATSSFS
jgi:hypothetical protein